MIELRNICKSYRTGSGRKVVLDRTSVVFPTGARVGILGLNGAGKSTLLRIIGGIEPPDRGRVLKDIRLSWPIGFSGGLHPDMTGRQNARFIARLYAASPDEIERSAEEFAELDTYYDMPVRTFSSGMRARLGFAIGLAAQFDCYLVDEVIAVGDKRFNEKYRKAFQERLRNASVILVSHNAKTIRTQCDMGAVLENGNLTMYDSVDQALKVYDQSTTPARR